MEGLFAPWHIAIVLVIALLVFGPKKLPQMGHSLGQSISGFRKGLQDAKEEFSGVMSDEGRSAEAVSADLATPSAPVIPSALAEPEAGTSAHSSDSAAGQ